MGFNPATLIFIFVKHCVAKRLEEQGTLKFKFRAELLQQYYCYSNIIVTAILLLQQYYCYSNIIPETMIEMFVERNAAGILF
jgi:hypothetical protein